MAAPTQVVTTPNRNEPVPPLPAYRTDLDGLRGIAIMLVACFHIWFGRVSGGVDVFLTLSGYFFVASLLKHVLATQPATSSWGAAINPWPRFSRLLRRLLPALLLVLAVTAVLDEVARNLDAPALRLAPDAETGTAARDASRRLGTDRAQAGGRVNR